MRAIDCAICGKPAKVLLREDPARGKMYYGIECEGCEHRIEPVFGTKNRAVAAWNECQQFVRRYVE